MIVLLTACDPNPMGYPEWRPAETLTYLNVRTGPGCEFECVDTIPPGVGIEVNRHREGVFETWTRLRTADPEQELWVCTGTGYKNYIVLLD